MIHYAYSIDGGFDYADGDGPTEENSFSRRELALEAGLEQAKAEGQESGSKLKVWTAQVHDFELLYTLDHIILKSIFYNDANVPFVDAYEEFVNRPDGLERLTEIQKEVDEFIKQAFTKRGLFMDNFRSYKEIMVFDGIVP